MLGSCRGLRKPEAARGKEKELMEERGMEVKAFMKIFPHQVYSTSTLCSKASLSF